MIGSVNGFDWDEGNIGKCQKHGVTPGEIEAVFRHPHRLSPALRHATQETRYLAIGYGGKSRAIFVVLTIRQIDGKRLIRPISARYMHDKEIRSYEEDTSNPELGR